MNRKTKEKIIKVVKRVLRYKETEFITPRIEYNPMEADMISVSKVYENHNNLWLNHPISVIRKFAPSIFRNLKSSIV